MIEELQQAAMKYITEENIDPEILEGFVVAAVSYAENYQRYPYGFYMNNPMGDKTKDSISQLASYFYRTRLGFPRGTTKGVSLWNELNEMLRTDRDWDI
jgi:hypothetical protein